MLPFAKKATVIIIAALCGLLVFSACSRDPQPSGEMPDDYLDNMASSVEMPQIGNSIAAQNDTLCIEISGVSDGYFFVQLKQKPANKLKLKVAHADDTYYYDLYYSEDPHIIPLQLGNGQYTVAVYEQVEGTRYAYVLGVSLTVKLKNEYIPFLLPNDIVYYSADSNAVRDGFILTYGAQSDIERVQEIFEYIEKNISYDYDKAATVEAGYIPDVDETLRTKKGICYDYAALFAAMLRANGIPAKLVIGYADPGNVYHAWNMVYITDVGWVDAEIYFDGKNWQLADSTFAAADSSQDYTYYPLYEY